MPEQQKSKGKSARECADEVMRRGGDDAKAIRYAIGYGAGLEKRRPGDGRPVHVKEQTKQALIE